ncbi:hypothetical protein BV898_11342 [Hypsibius exemplaris]|uniref:Gustatory receptor n=1 Tax=Hypsibius exemplaris TaxID=2072580 RepID=A0A1W0WH52_HYPEX|nr:hypothetical protein BV898_11342 [Hypsibius exemplaris]
MAARIITGKAQSHAHNTSTRSRDYVTALLSCFGLLSPTAKVTFRHPGFRVAILLAFSAFSLLYEVTIAVTKLATMEIDGNIAYAVNLSQYSIKAFTTLVILGMFWWKSFVIVSIVSTARMTIEQTKVVQRRQKGNKVFGRVLVTFATYLVLMACFRLLRIFSDSDKEPPFTTVLWPSVTLPKEQMVIFIVRNFTEATRLLCSGYLAGYLHHFAEGLGGYCKIILGKVVRDPLQQLSYTDLQRAWDAREEAITLAGTIKQQIGSFLTFILFSDMIAMFSTMGDFLFFSDSYVYLHNAVSILLYIVSSMSVAGGLIAMFDEDEETLQNLKMLKSSLINGSPCTRSMQRSSSLRSGKAQPLALHHRPVAAFIERDELVRLLSALKSSCFGTRKAVPDLPVFGYVNRGTIVNAVGLLFTFSCFMLDQYSRSETTAQVVAAFEAGTTGNTTM